MKKALIVAAGLRGIIGHNFFYTQTVQRELEKRGFEVTVFINKNAPADLLRETGYKAVFPLGTYDSIPLNGKVHDLVYTYLQAGIYSYELQSALNKLDDKDFDLVFFHTIADFELIGLNRYLKKNSFRGYLFVMQRFTLGFRTLSKWKTIFHPYWRMKPHYFKALYRRMKGRFVLLTDSELLTEDFANIFPHKIVTAPIPLEEKEVDDSDNSLFSRYNLQKSDFVDFGYLGDSREGKGFSMLPAMIKKALQSEKKLRFIIQCPNSEYDNEIPVGLTELEALAKTNPENVILVNERLLDEDYLRLFKFMDVIMIPYKSFGFVEGTSNIFTESAAFGKPVVVSNNTWMSNELKKYEGGLEFEKGNADDFAEKVVKLADNYSEFAKKASDFSSVWKATHNAENLVDLLLKEAKLN